MRNTKGDAHDRPSAPNFTSACIFMFGVNLVWILATLWAIWGFVAVLITSYGVHKWIDRIEASRR